MAPFSMPLGFVRKWALCREDEICKIWRQMLTQDSNKPVILETMSRAFCGLLPNKYLSVIELAKVGIAERGLFSHWFALYFSQTGNYSVKPLFETNENNASWDRQSNSAAGVVFNLLEWIFPEQLEKVQHFSPRLKVKESVLVLWLPLDPRFLTSNYF